MLPIVAQVELWRVPCVIVLACVLTLISAFPLRMLILRLRIMDKPGVRSSHSTPVPSAGGIAILLGAMVGMLVFGKIYPSFLVAAGIGLLVAAISFIDDVAVIPSLPRLIVHLVGATLTISLIGLGLKNFGLPYLHLHFPIWLGVAVAVLFTVGFVNFFNFMDGINGIAVAQGIFGGSTLAILLYWGGAENSVLVAAALAGGCLGFLPHNFPKAKMFMGDIGSATIGFALAMLTLLGAGRSDIPWVAMALPLGVFIYDATFTLFKRIIHGENFIKPHREHHYQLLIRCGWSHVKVTAIQVLLMILFCIGALVYASFGDAVQVTVLAVLLAVMVTYTILVHRYFRTHRQDAPGQEQGRQ